MKLKTESAKSVVAFRLQTYRTGDISRAGLLVITGFLRAPTIPKKTFIWLYLAS
jgi:hypothetical protein